MTRKLILATAASLVLAGVLANSTDADAATKAMSYKEAGEKIAEAQVKAYSEHKNVKVAVKVKATKKNVYVALSKISNHAYNRAHTLVFGEGAPDNMTIAALPVAFYSREHGIGVSDLTGKWEKCEEYSYGHFKVKGTVKKGYANIQFVFQGKGRENKVSEEVTAENNLASAEASLNIYNYLKTATEGKSQIERVAILDSFLAYRFSYTPDYWETQFTDWHVWNGKLKGSCMTYVQAFQRYADYAGIKHYGYTNWEAADHAMVAVRLENQQMIFFNYHGEGYEWYTPEQFVYSVADDRYDSWEDNYYVTIQGKEYKLLGDFDVSGEIISKTDKISFIMDIINTEFNGDIEAAVGMKMKDWILSEKSGLFHYGGVMNSGHTYTKKDIFIIEWENGKKEKINVGGFTKADFNCLRSKYKY